MYCVDALSSKLSLRDLTENLKFRRNFRRSFPNYFSPDGIILFCGAQGGGKTLSAVRYLEHVLRLYPHAQIVSNIDLFIDRPFIPYQGIEHLSSLDNGVDGIICLIDEIQVEFSSLESRSIHPSTLSLICQQRKRRLHIIGTSQLFSRIAKPWREQVSAVVECKSTLFGLVQLNSVVDFASIAEDKDGNIQNYKCRGTKFYFRCPALYDKYDTFSRVDRVGK